jgi:NAD-specific glutamate dehydrogenase
MHLVAYVVCDMTVPVPRVWSAGDRMDANLMNDITDAIMFALRPPEVQVERRAVQALTTGAFNAISFDTVVRDTHGFFSALTPTLVTVKVAGWYWLEYVMSWQSTGTLGQFVTSGVYVNGTAADQFILRQDTLTNISATNPLGEVVNRRAEHVYFQVGDVLDLAASQMEAKQTSTISDRYPQLTLRWASS